MQGEIIDIVLFDISETVQTFSRTSTKEAWGITPMENIFLVILSSYLQIGQPLEGFTTRQQLSLLRYPFCW